MPMAIAALLLLAAPDLVTACAPGMAFDPATGQPCPTVPPAATSPRILTRAGDLHLVVPPDGDVVLTDQGSPPRRVSLLARMASDADERVGINAAITLVSGRVGDAVSAAALLENNLRIGIADAVGDLRAEASQQTVRADRSLATLSSAVSASTVVLTSVDRVLFSNITVLASQAAEDLAELRALKSALLPAKPRAYVLSPQPFVVRVAYETLPSAGSTCDTRRAFCS